MAAAPAHDDSAQELLDYSDEELETNISRNLRIALALRNRTAVDLQKLLGLSKAVYSNRVTGKSRFTISEYLKVCAFLNVHPGDLATAEYSKLFQNWKFLNLGRTFAQVRALRALTRGRLQF